MLSNLLGFFSSYRAHHNSFILIIGSSRVECIHLVPEEPGVVEMFGSYSGRTDRPPPLPRTITSIQSREPLGELEVRVTEGESLFAALERLRDYVKKAYNACSTIIGDDKATGVDADELRLDQCKHALIQGFRSLVEEGHNKSTTGALPAKYMVELARISRSRPGCIWDESMLTSFPH
ncbi:uncharacterized protein LAESUDRAFT_729456 [Laetiporus sulphureus 93-53]|uniref:Uncharacterized protein n=1 Tax=Laetiporus sulphureus 93-53 TaxID=1314785 RepID=A0A165CPR6_9APHY|nr:uncharacterized protein LAESUDRAFT_729456 [Laetiporus sulphureus 93-53]KZT03196.1 hypothetical protein LAESUDRAFT_729456 [Laetiporus sulphureus 93-53]